MPTLEEIRARFSGDLYATRLTGVELVSAQPGQSECRLELKPHHFNARGIPQGGAVFTLADFAFAVAANGFEEDTSTISLQNDITYLSAARGRVLTAKARCIRRGRTVALYEVDVTDDLGKHIAHMTVNGFVTPKPQS